MTTNQRNYYLNEPVLGISHLSYPYKSLTLKCYIFWLYPSILEYEKSKQLAAMPT